MATEFLFSYGTLQLDVVQMATLAGKLTGTRDALPGFQETLLEIEDHATVSMSGSSFGREYARGCTSTRALRRRTPDVFQKRVA